VKYRELSPKFYKPEDEDLKVQKNNKKQITKQIMSMEGTFEDHKFEHKKQKN
jgi:hypothetical protein